MTTPHVLVLPFAPSSERELDVFLGDSLARTFRRRLESTGRRVVPLDRASHACRSLGIELPGGPLPELERDMLIAQTGATHVVCGRFDRSGQLSLKLWLLDAAAPDEWSEVQAKGPERFFQEVLDDALVRLIQTIPGARGEHVRRTLRDARTTESLDAYLAVVRARRAWADGDEETFEEEIEAASRLDPNYVDPHEVVAQAARAEGDTPRLVASLREVARVHTEAKRHHEQAAAHLSIGRALVEHGDWADGMEAYETAADLYEKHGEIRGWAQARVNVANVLLRQGDHEQAIAEYTSSLERVQDSPEDSVRCVFNLGLALKEIGDLDGAVARLEEARNLASQLRDDELIASTYNALGTVYDDKGDLDRALRQFRRAEEHLDVRTDPILLAGVKDHIGIIHKKQGDLEKALEYSEQACQLLEAGADPLHAAIAYVNRAGLLMELEREDDATPFVVAAHQDFVRLGSPSQATTLEMLVELGFDEESIEALFDEELDDDLDVADADDDQRLLDSAEVEDLDEPDEEGLDELEVDDD